MASNVKPKETDLTAVVLVAVVAIAALGGLNLGGSGTSYVEKYFINQTSESTEQFRFLVDELAEGYLQTEGITYNNSTLYRDGLYWNYKNKTFSRSQGFSWGSVSWLVIDANYGYGKISWKSVNRTINPLLYNSIIDMYGLVVPSKELKCDGLNTVTNTNILADKSFVYFVPDNVVLNASLDLGAATIEIYENGRYEGLIGIAKAYSQYNDLYEFNLTGDIDCYLYGDAMLKNLSEFDRIPGRKFVADCSISNGNFVYSAATGTYRNTLDLAKYNVTRRDGNTLYKIIKTSIGIAGFFVENLLGYKNFTVQAEAFLYDVVSNLATIRIITVNGTKLYNVYYLNDQTTHIYLPSSGVYSTASVNHPSDVFIVGIRQADIGSLITGNNSNLCDSRNILALRATKTRLDIVDKG
ncbi:MAG: hypothetical protein QXR05_07090 [Candidatus Methanomethylicia archaeon]